MSAPTPTDFLLARIAEDELTATLVAAAEADPSFSMTVYPHDGDRISVDVPAMTAARVLAECEAKRRIVEESALWGCQKTMSKILALSYADHPGWREEWRP